MSLKPNKNTALSRRNKTEDKQKITTITSTRNTTTGTSPTTLRLTPHCKAEANLWLNELSELAGKKITLAKVVQGIVEMKDDINNTKLLNAIREASF